MEKKSSKFNVVAHGFLRTYQGRFNWHMGAILARCPSCYHQWFICVPARTEHRLAGHNPITGPS